MVPPHSLPTKATSSILHLFLFPFPRPFLKTGIFTSAAFLALTSFPALQNGGPNPARLSKHQQQPGRNLLPELPPNLHLFIFPFSAPFSGLTCPLQPLPGVGHKLHSSTARDPGPMVDVK